MSGGTVRLQSKFDHQDQDRLLFPLSPPHPARLHALRQELAGGQIWPIADYTEAITIDRKYVDAYCNRGAAFGEKGEQDKAIADFTQAIRIDPRCVQAYYNRGMAYRVKGDDRKADDDFARANALGFKP